MTSAVALLAQRRLTRARAELDAQRLADALLNAKGKDGKSGERGDIGPMPDHEWKGTQLRFQKPDGSWGEWVDLRGAKGARGDRGPSGGGGGASAPAPGGGIEHAIYTDASRPIAYVGYSNRIVRMDYATWPPVETTASTTSVHADWPSRASLEYA